MQFDTKRMCLYSTLAFSLGAVCGLWMTRTALFPRVSGRATLVAVETEKVVTVVETKVETVNVVKEVVVEREDATVRKETTKWFTPQGTVIEKSVEEMSLSLGVAKDVSKLKSWSQAERSEVTTQRDSQLSKTKTELAEVPASWLVGAGFGLSNFTGEAYARAGLYARLGNLPAFIGVEVGVDRVQLGSFEPRGGLTGTARLGLGLFAEF